MNMEKYKTVGLKPPYKAATVNVKTVLYLALFLETGNLPIFHLLFDCFKKW